MDVNNIKNIIDGKEIQKYFPWISKKNIYG